MNLFAITFSLILGYTVFAGLLLVTVFGLAPRAPGFVMKEYRIRTQYKVAEELVWLACAIAGGYTVAWFSAGAMPWLTGGLLAGIIILILWTNLGETQQRGILHQTLMSAISVAGVVAGFTLRLRHLSPASN